MQAKHLKLLITYLLLLHYSFEGYTQNSKESTPTNKPTLTPVWIYKTAQPFFASPVIVNNLIFCGNLDSTMHAIDLITGKPIWKFHTQGEIRSTAALYGNQLAFVSGDGNVYALDQKTGRLLWKFKTQGERTYSLYSYADYYQSSPIFEKGILYFGSGDSYVYALDANNGTLKWKFKTGDVVHARPALHNNQLFIGSFDGYVYALDAIKGTLIWKFKSVGQQFFPKGEMQGNPTVFNDRIFIGSRDYNLYAINIKEGYGLWNRQFAKGWAMGTPVVKDSVLYVGTSDDMVLLALDPYTGRTKWQAAVKFNVFGAPAIADTSVFIGTLMGKLFGIDRRTGAILWTYETEAYKRNKARYFTENDVYRNDIQQIIRKGEDFITMYYDLGAFFSSPVITGNKLIISSTDGAIYCFNKE